MDCAVSFVKFGRRNSGFSFFGATYTFLSFAKERKGQVAIEFMLLIMIMGIFIISTSIPAIDNAQNAARDISLLSQTKASTERIVASINEVASASGDAKKTITILLPSPGNPVSADVEGLDPPMIELSDNSISFTVEISAAHDSCTDTQCTKSYTPKFTLGNGSLNKLLGPGEYLVVIEKTDGVIRVNATKQ